MSKILFVLIILIATCCITAFSSVEEFTTGRLNNKGSDLDYSIGKGLKVSWENENHDDTMNNVENNLNTNVSGEVPLPEGRLYMFYKNKFSHDCCPSSYSSSTGCLCVSKEQSKYLNERAGNRTLTSLY